MLTLHGLITDALYETDSCPCVGQLTIRTTTEPTIHVDIEIDCGTTLTAYSDGVSTSYRTDPVEYTATDHTDWAPGTDPTIALSDITSGAIPHGADESDVSMDLTIPAEMLAQILDTYLDGTPEVVMPWTADPACSGRNPGFVRWNSTVRDLTKRSTTGTWIDGLWAGVILYDALRLAAHLDDELAAIGQPPAFTELCTPRLVTGDDILAGLVNHIEALTARAWTLRHRHTIAAA